MATELSTTWVSIASSISASQPEPPQHADPRLAQGKELFRGEGRVGDGEVPGGNLTRQPFRGGYDRLGRAAVVECAGQHRELGCFGNSQPIDRQPCGRHHHPKHALAEHEQARFHLAVRIHGIEDVRQVALAFARHPGGEQLGLAGEVVVEGTLGDAGAGGDARHAGALVAILREDDRRAAQDLPVLLRREDFHVRHQSIACLRPPG